MKKTKNLISPLKPVLKKTITIFMLIASISFSSYAFNGITTNTEVKTKVIFVFSNESKKMTGIILYESVNKKNMELFIQKYKDYSFFFGYIEGDFERREVEIKPIKGSIITIVKDRNSDLYKNPNLGLWDKTKVSTSLFVNEKSFPKETFSVYFNYKSWPCNWRGFSIKNDKNYLIINVI